MMDPFLLKLANGQIEVEIKDEVTIKDLKTSAFPSVEHKHIKLFFKGHPGNIKDGQLLSELKSTSARVVLTQGERLKKQSRQANVDAVDALEQVREQFSKMQKQVQHRVGEMNDHLDTSSRYMEKLNGMLHVLDSERDREAVKELYDEIEQFRKRKLVLKR